MQGREGEEGGDVDENKNKSDDIGIDRREDDGNVAENISGKVSQEKMNFLKKKKMVLFMRKDKINFWFIFLSRFELM